MRFKSGLIRIAILGSGVLVGVAVTKFDLLMAAGGTSSREPVPLSAVVALGPEPPVNVPVSRSAAQDETAMQVAQQIARLERKLEKEVADRQKLVDELNDVRAELRSIEQRLDDFSEGKPESDSPSPQIGRSQQISPATFVEAGFSAEEAETVSALWGQQQMDLLYLRDQASREGWLNSPRYAEAVRDLRTGEGSLRAELSLASYDRFLYATGQSNRVVLNSVIESSPAQDIGLQLGDTILTYGDTRILSATDLRTATQDGDPDIPVVMVVERDGQMLEFEIARGPIGVTLGTRRVKP